MDCNVLDLGAAGGRVLLHGGHTYRGGALVPGSCMEHCQFRAEPEAEAILQPNHFELCD